MTRGAVVARAAVPLLLVTAALGLDFAMALSRLEWAAVAGVTGAIGTLLGGLLLASAEPPGTLAEPSGEGARPGQRHRIAAALGCAALVCAPVAAMGRARPAGWILGVVVVILAAAALGMLRGRTRAA